MELQLKIFITSPDFIYSLGWFIASPWAGLKIKKQQFKSIERIKETKKKKNFCKTFAKLCLYSFLFRIFISDGGVYSGRIQKSSWGGYQGYCGGWGITDPPPPTNT